MINSNPFPSNRNKLSLVVQKMKEAFEFQLKLVDLSSNIEIKGIMIEMRHNYQKLDSTFKNIKQFLKPDEIQQITKLQSQLNHKITMLAEKQLSIRPDTMIRGAGFFNEEITIKDYKIEHPSNEDFKNLNP